MTEIELILNFEKARKLAKELGFEVIIVGESAEIVDGNKKKIYRKARITALVDFLAGVDYERKRK